MKIYQGATLVATVEKGEHFHRLRYTEDYLGSPQAIALSRSLPLSAARHENIKVLRWFENLLTENPLVLNSLQKQYKIPDISDPICVLERIGRDAPGAFTFTADYEEYDLQGTARKVSETEIGENLRRLATLTMPSSPRLSLPGVQPKTSYTLGQDGAWYEATGAIPSTHILKPPTPGNQNIQYVEHVIQRTAQRLGIESAHTSIVSFAGQPCLLVKRYDRRKTADGLSIRLHQEDLLQVLGRSRAQKYQFDSGPGIKELTQTVRQLAPLDEPTLWRLLAYNVAIGNSDAHAKNYSFLVTPHGYRLAPAYDLNSLIPYPHYSQQLAMSIGKNYDYRRISIADWKDAARRSGTDPDAVLEQVEYVNENVLCALEQTLAETGAHNAELEQIHNYVRQHFPPAGSSTGLYPTRWSGDL